VKRRDGEPPGEPNVACPAGRASVRHRLGRSLALPGSLAVPASLSPRAGGRCVRGAKAGRAGPDRLHARRSRSLAARVRPQFRGRGGPRVRAMRRSTALSPTCYGLARRIGGFMGNFNLAKWSRLRAVTRLDRQGKIIADAASTGHGRNGVTRPKNGLRPTQFPRVFPHLPVELVERPEVRLGALDPGGWIWRLVF
jgi:hypothetical protein